ncbi:hypothetical protein [Streptomyces sp. SID13031]|uniref:hypothetical protein n=1 Tax=Streptomyces sp. SID13031 TaxID=2706046 RepID=UPI0013C64F4E|nr:hypothetical protein [Streptomyces sp. SID13031]NEA30709.1 hypothetical protein [Streptomyces sp. SID13031]
MADYPSLTITALGTRGSGKTTFLLGMYAELSAGRKGYFLNATDPDVDLVLAERWDKLLEDGELPPPNLADNIPYTFLFLDGLSPLLAIDWLDYRGGALSDARGAESGDVAGLQDRLERSDSVYLVIDGGYLVEPVTESTRRDILGRTGLRRMTSLLQNAVQARMKADEPLPSIVILITKADLIPPWRRDSLDAVVREVQELIGIGFSQGLSTLVCPVTLGHFGLHPPARVETGDIDPRDLHLPVIYSLAEYMYQLSVAAKGAAADAAQTRQALQNRLAALRQGAGALFRRSDIRDAVYQEVIAERDFGSYDAVQQVAAKRADTLFAELDRLPRFRDGVEVSQ